MKKQLLLGSALIAAISAFPQTGRVVPKGTGVQPVNMAEIANQRYINQLHAPEPTQQTPVTGPQKQVTAKTAKASANPTTTVFQPFSGSANVFGVLESNSRPLCYNNELNLVSFVHRKSSTYVTNPVQTTTGAISGAIIAELTDDWGTNWDSTCVWNNATYWARYPQGGVYNPPSNTVIPNAYVVASGPVTGQAGQWQGSFLATKQLDTLGGAGNDSTGSNVTGAQLFVSNTATNNVTKKFDFPSLHFSTTDDGKVHMVGMYTKDYNATTSAAFGFMGANVITGTFNNSTNTMDWTGEYILPPVRTVPSLGYKQLVARPHMAWNESGTVGYVWFIGCDSNAVNVESSGYQPIVYKTTNGGGSWSQVPGINFQNPKFTQPVMNWLFSTAANTAITIPYFYTGEGVDGIVDANDNLHIVTTLIATARSNPDSLGYIWPEFPLGPGADNEKYTFGERPGFRPYIYDFYTSSNGWEVALIDSMSSESPGTKSADPGFADNPWDANTDKSETDARLQLSRTPDGKYLICTWAESDTLFTNNQHKWNAFPDVHARLLKITPSGTVSVHPTEINITGNANVLVAGRATKHYVSERAPLLVPPTFTGGVAIGLPLTVSNNTSIPMMQYNSVTHYYTSAVLNFDNVSASNLQWPTRKVSTPTTTTGVNAANVEFSNGLYPNPASGKVTVSLMSKQAANADIRVINMVGQIMKSVTAPLQAGENDVNVNIAGLPTGMYMVTVQSGASKITSKLIVE